MREAITALLVLCSCSATLGNSPDTIKPGISLEAAKAVLYKHGYEIDAQKYGFAMAALKDQSLEFAPIDKNITLVIQYSQSTNKVKFLGIVIIPDNSATKLQQVWRNALEVSFEDGGIYALKLNRTASETATINEQQPSR